MPLVNSVNEVDHLVSIVQDRRIDPKIVCNPVLLGHRMGREQIEGWILVRGMGHRLYV